MMHEFYYFNIMLKKDSSNKQRDKKAKEKIGLIAKTAFSKLANIFYDTTTK